MKIDTGFTQIPNWLLKDEGILKPMDKMVYCILKSYTYVGNDECFPSYDTIAKNCGSTRKTVIKYVARLKKLGLINVITGHTGKSNIYTFPDEIPKIFK